VSFLRRLSTARLLAVLGGAAAVAAGTAAIAIAATSGGTPPPREPLAVAVHRALAAPAPAGVTARIRFTDHLVDAGGLPGGGPLLSGATGRLWASADGRFRLELQADQGDVQLLGDGRTLTLYDAHARTAYTVALPAGRADAGAHRALPSVATIERALTRLARGANVSGAEPTTVAGRPAYAVRIGPRGHAGLLGGARLAWDAATGTPLSVGVCAAGRSDPVLELTATDVSFGPVDASVFDVQPPAGTRTVDLTPQLRRLAAATAHAKGHRATPVAGLARVRRAAGFAVSAPAALAGLPRTGVRLAPGASVVAAYGRGPGGLLVLERPAAAGDRAGDALDALPAVSVGGATGHELATPLGTVLTFERGGVAYTVLGSVPPATAERAARGL